MGKLPHCEIKAEHPTVSRVHTVLVACQKQGPCVVDLGTVNGTFLGGAQLQPFTPTPLRATAAAGDATKRATAAAAATAAATAAAAPQQLPPLVLARSSRSYACVLCTNAKERRAKALQAQVRALAQPWATIRRVSWCTPKPIQEPVFELRVHAQK